MIGRAIAHCDGMKQRVPLDWQTVCARPCLSVMPSVTDADRAWMQKSTEHVDLACAVFTIEPMTADRPHQPPQTARSNAERPEPQESLGAVATWHESRSRHENARRATSIVNNTSGQANQTPTGSQPTLCMRAHPDQMSGERRHDTSRRAVPPSRCAAIATLLHPSTAIPTRCREMAIWRINTALSTKPRAILFGVATPCKPAGLLLHQASFTPARTAWPRPCVEIRSVHLLLTLSKRNPGIAGHLRPDVLSLSISIYIHVHILLPCRTTARCAPEGLHHDVLREAIAVGQAIVDTAAASEASNMHRFYISYR